MQAIEQFNPTKHMDQIREWMRGRDDPDNHFDIDLLPDSGFIIPQLAAVFWWHTNGPVIFMDVLITNPRATIGERSEAAKLLLFEGLKLATAINVKRIYFHTKQPMVIKHYAPMIGATCVRQGIDLYQWDNPKMRKPTDDSLYDANEWIEALGGKGG